VPPESRKRFKAALALLEAGESEALIFTKVDRASRCTEDFPPRSAREVPWVPPTRHPCDRSRL
jgi:DNA invertase Pin-like site-specific DNA recombinase